MPQVTEQSLFLLIDLNKAVGASVDADADVISPGEMRT